MTIHLLSCDPATLADIAVGNRTHDVRPNFGCVAGDMVHLYGWDSTSEAETGQHVAAHVTHVLRADDPTGAGGLLASGTIVLSLERYRTWIEGQRGPGEWQREPVPVDLASSADSAAIDGEIDRAGADLLAAHLAELKARDPATLTLDERLTLMSQRMLAELGEALRVGTAPFADAARNMVGGTS